MRIAAALLALLTAAHALAEGHNKEEATRLTELGGEALRRGDNAEALARFQAAYRAFPTPNLRYDLGVAQDALDDAAAAITSFEAFLRDAADAPTEARVHAETRIEALRPRVARLEVAVTPPESLVRLNGIDTGAGAHRIIYVAPGTIRVEAERAGFVGRHTEVGLHEGEMRSLSLSLEAVVEAPAIPLRRSSRPLLKASIALGSLAVTTLVTGVVFGALAQSASHQLDAVNANQLRFDLDLERTGKLYQGLEAGLLAVGGAATVAAVVTFALDRRAAAVDANP